MEDEEYQGALGDWGDEEYDGALGDWGDEGEGAADGGEESGAIAEVDSGDIMHFKINPESIEDSKDTSYANIEIPGMRLANSLAKRPGISTPAAANAFYLSRFICIMARATTCRLV